VFSYGVFGLILIGIMLFFPRGLLPALGDAMAGVGRRLSAARAPSESASDASSADNA
jgi:hypothetical protein